MKPLVIYHANCADGFGAAFAAWLKLGEEAEYLATQYGEKVPLDPSKILYEDRDVYVLDFSFPKDTMDRLFAAAKQVVWLDHHKTAFEMWCGGIPTSGYWRNDGESELSNSLSHEHYIELGNDRSGAMLAWEYFHPDKEVPLLIKHIDDYDRWQFKIEGTKEFNKALWSYAPWSFGRWNDMVSLGYFELNSSYYKNFLNEGAAILRAHDANVQTVIKGATRECNLLHEEHGYAVGLAANCPPHLASDVGHALANASGTYGLLWYISKENKCKCSLRSNGDYDVSAIAKAFGGGGHKNAAGFEVPISILLDWIK
jgi:oligoribonuclease NrnB/cAMP/cGMP phosphodiesterase (DHH superfamily)